MKLKNRLLYIILSIAILPACTKDVEVTPTPAPPTSNLVIPLAYDSSNYPTAIAFVSSIRANLDALVTEVKKGRIIGQKLSATALKASFRNDALNIEGITTTYYVGQLTQANGWFDKAEKASGNVYRPDSASIVGGTYGGYLFDENGFEPEQMIEKGLFGAALSNKVIELITNSPTVDKVDQALHIIGGTPHFKSSNAAKHASAADKYLAVYIARRDKNDGAGFYSQMKFNFIKLKAAIKAGAGYNKERDEASAALRLILEQTNYATVINYCHTSIANLSKTNLTDAEKAATLHAIGECHGFALGWKNVTGKKITETQIDAIMELLNAPLTGIGKPSLFITDRANQIAKLQQIINKVKNIYGFTDTQVEDFKKNWVAEQNR